MELVLEKLVTRFDQNPATAGKLMRGLQVADPESFFCACVPILNRIDPRKNQGGEYLVTLLLASGHLPDALADTDLFHLEAAVRVASVAGRVDPQVAVNLAHRLGHDASADGADDARLLDILEAIQPARSILPLIARLLQHPSSRVRSKAALLVGRGNRNVHWVQQQLAEPDARVRANAIESIWGVDSEDARRVLWEATRDPDNRVAGNAVAGLHKLGDPASIREVLKLAGHAAAPFRATAAWVMGECDDPRFLEALGDLAGDGDSTVRRNAIRSLSRLNGSCTRMRGAGSLRVYVSQARFLDDGARTFHLAVTGDDGAPLDDVAGTQIVIREGARPVIDFQVDRPARAASLSVAFGLPRSRDHEEWRRPAEGAVLGCLAKKRSADRWAVVNYAPGVDLSFQPELPRTVADRRVLEQMIQEPGDPSFSPAGPLEALERMLDAVTPLRGARALIFIADTGGGTGALTMESYRWRTGQILRQACASRIAVHAILPPRGSSLVEAALQEICPGSGGILLRTGGAEELPDAVARLYLGSLDRYQVTYRLEKGMGETSPWSPPLHVEIFCPHGWGEDLYPPPGHVYPAAA